MGIFIPAYKVNKEEKMKEKLKNKKKQIIIISTLIIILLLFFSGFSIGKAYSNTQINGISEVAMPILEVENGKTLKIDNQNKEGTYEHIQRAAGSAAQATRSAAPKTRPQLYFPQPSFSFLRKYI